MLSETYMNRLHNTSSYSSIHSIIVNLLTCMLHCNRMLAETGRATGFLAAIPQFSMRPIRETKSQPHPMRGLAMAHRQHTSLQTTSGHRSLIHHHFLSHAFPPYLPRPLARCFLAWMQSQCRACSASRVWLLSLAHSATTTAARPAPPAAACWMRAGLLPRSPSAAAAALPRRRRRAGGH